MMLAIILTFPRLVAIVRSLFDQMLVILTELGSSRAGISVASNFGQPIIVECIIPTGIWSMKSDLPWAYRSHLGEQIVGVESSRLKLEFDPARPEGGRADLPSATGEDMPCGAALV